jgi:hypothetical protein
VSEKREIKAIGGNCRFNYEATKPWNKRRVYRCGYGEYDVCDEGYICGLKSPCWRTIRTARGRIKAFQPKEQK